MSRQLQECHQERGIQAEPTAGYSPEANGLAERNNLTLLDIALPMLADSGDQLLGLPPLGPEHAGEHAGGTVRQPSPQCHSGKGCPSGLHTACRLPGARGSTVSIPLL
jgi:hypothetical protein